MCVGKPGEKQGPTRPKQPGNPARHTTFIQNRTGPLHTKTNAQKEQTAHHTTIRHGGATSVATAEGTTGLSNQMKNIHGSTTSPGAKMHNLQQTCGESDPRISRCHPFLLLFPCPFASFMPCSIGRAPTRPPTPPPLHNKRALTPYNVAKKYTPFVSPAASSLGEKIPLLYCNGFLTAR